MSESDGAQRGKCGAHYDVKTTLGYSPVKNKQLKAGAAMEDDAGEDEIGP